MNSEEACAEIETLGAEVEANIGRIDFCAGWKGTQDDLRLLKDIEGLEQIGLWGRRYENKMLYAIASLELPIESIWFDDTNISDDGLAALLMFQNLTTLSLTHVHEPHSSFTNRALEHVGKIKTLEKVHLYQRQICDQGLAFLTGLTELTELSLAETSVTGDGFRHLPSKKLTWIDLSDTPIKDEAFATLIAFTELRDLILTKTNVTDEAFVHIAQIPQLRHLDIAATKTTGKGIRLLAESKQLEALTVWGTDISDEDLLQLASLDRLSYISAWNTSIGIDDAHHDLCQQLPNLEFEFYRPDAAYIYAPVECAKDMFFCHYGSQSFHEPYDQEYAADNLLKDLDDEYAAFNIHESVERQWIQELTEEEIGNLILPENSRVIRFLMRHEKFNYLPELLAAKPLGLLAAKCDYLEMLLCYIAECRKRELLGERPIEQLADAYNRVISLAEVVLKGLRSAKSKAMLHAIIEKAQAELGG